MLLRVRMTSDNYYHFLTIIAKQIEIVTYLKIKGA